jgi:uncharacterized protein
MENTICHFELPADDLDAARSFYSSVFGWTITPAPNLEGEYLFIQTSSQPGALGGGLLKRREQRQPAVYVLVESVEETGKRIEELGGQILKPKAAIPTLGWAVTAQDPQGNTIGLFQQDTQAR